MLNAPAAWKAKLDTARSLLQQAKHLQMGAEQPLDKQLQNKIEKLELLLAADETNYKLAIRLEKIREDRANDLEKASMQYRMIFREAGFEEKNGKPKKKAAIIRPSAIREQLVAALDDWAMVAWTAGSKKLAQKLPLPGQVGVQGTRGIADGEKTARPEVEQESHGNNRQRTKAFVGYVVQFRSCCQFSWRECQMQGAVRKAETNQTGS